VSKDATIDARGCVSADQTRFTVSGTNEQLVQVGPPEKRDDDWRMRVSEPEK
jgi:hypothetical protein